MQENNPHALSSGSTPIHRLYPRTKMALLAAVFLAALLPQRPEIVAGATCAVLVQVALARAWC